MLSRAKSLLFNVHAVVNQPPPITGHILCANPTRTFTTHKVSVHGATSQKYQRIDITGDQKG